MKPFAGAPWSKPTQIGGEEVHKYPDYFSRYKSMTGAGGAAAVTRKAQGIDATMFEPCATNPCVAMDFAVHKYRLLIFTNDKVETRGQFFSEASGMTGYSGYVDMKSIGPHGVQGVPASAHSNGPPGSSIMPKDHWMTNKGDRARPRTLLLKGKGMWSGNPPDHSGTYDRPDIVRSSDSLARDNSQLRMSL